MGLFDIFKKPSEPYTDSSTNLIYNLLFCDSLDLYKTHHGQATYYPWNILFADTSSIEDLQEIVDDQNVEARVKILACNKQRASGHKVERKELLGVIVEVGLDNGLDTLGSFKDGSARYMNQTGRIIVWETTTETSDALTTLLFNASERVVANIGPWDEPRRTHPPSGNARITFLVSDGLYFGEGPINVLFNDPLASPALASATELMRFLLEQTLGPSD